MSDQGVCISVNLSLKSEHADWVCEQLKVLVEETRNVAGFRDVEIVRSAEDPTKVLFFEHWDDLPSYQSYVSWRTEMGGMDALVEKMVAPPKINVWPLHVVSASRG